MFKAAGFAAAWLVLPGWLFAIVSFLLYFVPLFQADAFFFAFLVLVGLAIVQAPTILFGMLFGGMFYYLLLIKNLLIIDRRGAFEILIMALCFFSVRDFYAHFVGGVGGVAILGAFCLGALFAILIGELMNMMQEDGVTVQERNLRNMVKWFLWVFACQLLVVGLFLPLDFRYQSAIIFLPLVLCIDLLPDWTRGIFSGEKIFISGAVIGSTMVIVFTAARWFG